MTDPLLAVTIAIGVVAVLLIVFDQGADPGGAAPRLTDRPHHAPMIPVSPRARPMHGSRSGGDAIADRELIETNPDDERYVRRVEDGQFDETDDVGMASAHDQRRDAESETKRGQGDRGDREGS
jgi:hypothetical protein